MNDTGGGDAWDPGIDSAIPRRLLPRVTLYRPENAFLDHVEVEELADLSGLAKTELVAFRPERLVVHELLVRVTADLSVPDGPNYADLGISLRTMVATLLESHVAPHMEDVRAAFDAERERLERIVDERLSAELFDPGGQVRAAGHRGDGGGRSGGGEGDGAAPGAGSWLSRLFGGGRREPPAPRGPVEPRELLAIAAWRERLAACEEPRERACLAALVRTVESIVGHRGRVFADRELVRRLATNLACGERGARVVAERIEPLVAAGIESEGYRVLPAQAKPVVMNVKGASASGKSTIRPRQRELAEKLDIPWEDFALISPDYWRKYLLDYDSLGEDARYAAMLCGEELAIVDRKLDRYMADKASRGRMSHLLIDRFRFDSFALDDERAADSKLLTRFGHRLFLFFVLTSPTQTVERAWVRGERTGRYKAVSDLLFHNVEAYTGMPALYLSWANPDGKEVHVEFLDNDVPEGALPRSAAFGWNDTLTILDVDALLDVDRHRKIDIEARSPEAVAGSADLSPGANLGFVRRCAARIGRVDFADRDTGEIYARVEGGRLLWWDLAYVERLDREDGARVVLADLGLEDPPGEPATADGAGAPALDVARERRFTVGQWGEATEVAGA